MALAWPLDKYECLTVDITRVSNTRKWGREPRQDREEREAKLAAAAAAGGPAPAPEAAEWGGPLGILMRLTGRGVKRPRESSNSNSNSNGGQAAQNRWPRREPENPWQVCWSGREIRPSVPLWIRCSWNNARLW